MNRFIRTGTLSAALLGAGYFSIGAADPLPSSGNRPGSTSSSKEAAKPRTAIVREPGQPDRSCIVVGEQKQADGSIVYRVKAIDNGEELTITHRSATPPVRKSLPESQVKTASATPTDLPAKTEDGPSFGRPSAEANREALPSPKAVEDAPSLPAKIPTSPPAPQPLDAPERIGPAIKPNVNTEATPQPITEIKPDRSSRRSLWTEITNLLEAPTSPISPTAPTAPVDRPKTLPPVAATPTANTKPIVVTPPTAETVANPSPVRPARRTLWDAIFGGPETSVPMVSQPTVSIPAAPPIQVTPPPARTTVMIGDVPVLKTVHPVPPPTPIVSVPSVMPAPVAVSMSQKPVRRGFLQDLFGGRDSSSPTTLVENSRPNVPAMDPVPNAPGVAIIKPTMEPSLNDQLTAPSAASKSDSGKPGHATLDLRPVPTALPTRAEPPVAVEPNRISPVALSSPSLQRLSPEAQKMHSLFTALKSAERPSQRMMVAEELLLNVPGNMAEVRTALMSAAKDDSAACVRAACIRCLSKLGARDESFLKLLNDANADENDEVRTEATFALQKVKK